MRVLIVANHNKGYYAPFIIEQVDALKRLGVECEYFGIHGKGISGYLSNLEPLKKKIQGFQPDLIHAHYGLSGFLANLQRRIPVITTYHGSDIHSKGLNIKISKSAAYFSVYNIYVSKPLLNLSGFKGGERCVIPCGVDTTTFHPIDQNVARDMLGWDINGKYILFAGAFDNDIKNSTLAKEAVSLVHNAKLVELRDYNRKQVNILMNASNCLLMTSHREGSPVVIKEAMACGTPIVSVNVGDVKELTENVECCYITSYNAQEIAENLQKALSFQGKTNGHNKILEKGLSNEYIASQILDIYQRVIEKQSPSKQ